MRSLARIGRNVLALVRPGAENAAALRRFATAEEDRRLRRELTLSVIVLLVFLTVVGWALTL